MRATVLVVGAVTLISASSATAGDVLIDAHAREATLAATPLPDRRRLCAPPHPIGPLAAPVRRFGIAGDAPDTLTAARFMTAVGWLAAARLGLGDSAAAAKANRGLEEWALAGAASAISPDEGTPLATRVFHQRAFLSGLIPAWAILRRLDPPDARAQRRIDRWIDRLVAKIDIDTGPLRTRGRCTALRPGEISSDCNNHAYLRIAVVTAHAALRGRRAQLVRGMEQLAIAAEQRRPDGGLPLELARGTKADWYQANAAASLTMTAIALEQAGLRPFGDPAIRAGLRAILRRALQRRADAELAVAGRRIGVDATPSARPRFDKLLGGPVGCFFGR